MTKIREKLRGVCIGLVLVVTVVVSVATQPPHMMVFSQGVQTKGVLLSKERQVRRFVLRLPELFEDGAPSEHLGPKLRFQWQDEESSSGTSLARVRLSWPQDAEAVNCFVQESLCEHVDLEGRTQESTREGVIFLAGLSLNSSRRLPLGFRGVLFVSLSLEDGSSVRGDLSVAIELGFFDHEAMRRAQERSSTAVLQESILE